MEKILKPYKEASPAHITQYFSPQHRAIDLAYKYGTFLVSPADCVVERIMTAEKLEANPDELDRGYSIVLKKKNEPTTQFAYFHCLPFFPVKEGDEVRKGQIVAQMGNSGLVKYGISGKIVPLELRTKPPYPGTHTHFVVRVDYTAVDPMLFIDWNAKVEYDASGLLNIIFSQIRATSSIIKNIVDFLKGRVK